MEAVTWQVPAFEKGFVHIIEFFSGKYTGKTLSDTIRDIKMRYASTQLSLTTMPIKTIARNCGYANLGHFYKIFEKQYGCTPKQYRSDSQKPV